MEKRSALRSLHPGYEEEFEEKIRAKEEQRIKARCRECENYNWLGMLGLIGWSVMIPLIGGIFLGIWLDSVFKGKYSFTLIFMLSGLAAGCLLSWHWIQKAAGCFGKENRGKNVKSNTCKE